MGRLRLIVAGRVATLVLDHPSKRNAIDLETWSAFPSAVTAIEGDDRIRVVVVRGAGSQAFSSGADLSEFDQRRRGRDAAAYTEAVRCAERSLASLRKPTIAMVHGWCVGGGCELALACDIRMASVAAKFGIPASKFGLVYSQTSTAQLTRAVGTAWAMYLLATAELISAEEAVRIGLIQIICESDQLEDAVGLVAHNIAQRAPVSLAAAKFFVSRAGQGTGEEDADARCWYATSYSGSDYSEALDARRSKRVPDFGNSDWPDPLRACRDADPLGPGR